MSPIARVAACLAAVVTVGSLSIGTAHAVIPEGAIGTVEVVCETPNARLVFTHVNNSGMFLEYTTSYSVNGGAPSSGGGGGNSGSGSSSSIGVQAGDVIDASISIEGDLADELVDFVVPNCVEQETTATLTVACNGETAELVIAFANTFEAAIIYNYGYQIWDGEAIDELESNAEVDLETPFTLSVPLEAGDEVSAMIVYGEDVLDQIDEVVAPDCSDAGSGGAIPDTGSNTAPLMLSAAGLLGLGLLLTLTVRRRSTV